MIIRGNISRGGVEIQKAALPRRVRGFSLIEMLVVIAVIGILAGILLGAMPAIQERRIRSQVRAELRNLLTAIETYKEKHGFYPPDNPDATTPANAAKAIAQPPLFYELVGTLVSNNTFYPLNGSPNELTPLQIKNYFGPDGFMNSSADKGEAKNFYTIIKTNSQYVVSPFATGADKPLVLRVPAKGPTIPAFPAAAADLNTWRYIVAKPRRGPNDRYPTNNPNTFDLWADVTIRGRTVTIGNWKEQ